jgi:hypothetical protein
MAARYPAFSVRMERGTLSVIVATGLNAKQVPLMIHGRAKHNRSTTYPAVFHVFLGAARTIYDSVKSLAAIRATDARYA